MMIFGGIGFLTGNIGLNGVILVPAFTSLLAAVVSLMLDEVV